MKYEYMKTHVYNKQSHTHACYHTAMQHADIPKFTCTGAHSTANAAHGRLITKGIVIHSLKCSLIICRARGSCRCSSNAMILLDSRILDASRITVSFEVCVSTRINKPQKGPVRMLRLPRLCSEESRRTLITVPKLPSPNDFSTWYSWST